MAPEPLWKPFDPVHSANPYVMYRRLREQDPVHRAQTGEWIITRYEDARNILRSPDFLVGNRFDWLKKGVGYLKERDLDFTAIELALKGFILFLNPPHHTRIRKVIHQAWDSRRVEQLIQHNLDALLPRNGNSIDFINDISKPLPAMTIGKILGLPETDYAYLKAQGAVIIKALDLYISLKDVVKINAAAQNFIEYFKQVLQQKEQHPDDGVIGNLVRINKQEHVLDGDELISVCILLFIAGEETSVSLLGTGLYNLVSRPHDFEKLKRNPDLIPVAVEELLRYDTPVQIVGRIAGKACTLHGKAIQPGDTLTICLGSANRDPEVFEDADALVIERTPNKHLGFGGGAHYCLGDWLARVQAQLMFKTVLERYSSIELLDAQPAWNNNLAIRCLTSLPVTVK